MRKLQNHLGQRKLWINVLILYLKIQKLIVVLPHSNKKKNFWVIKNNFLKKFLPIMRDINLDKSKKPTYREDTGIALATRSKFIRKGERIGKKVKCISYDDPKYNIDINNIEDLNLAKKF